MDSFLRFIGKLIFGCGVWNNQEEINDPPIGHQNNPRETISSDCNPNPSDEQVLWELLTTSYVDPLSSNSSEQANTYAYVVSVPSIQGSSETGRLLVESNFTGSVLDTEPDQVNSQVAKGESSFTDHLTLIQQSTSRNRIGDDSFKYYGDDSSMEKLTSPGKTISEPDSTPKECKKKSSRRKQKAMKLSLMNNQNRQHNSTSQSCHLRSNFVEHDSGNYVIASSSQGSTENGHILAEPVSSPKLLGSQKQKLVMLKGTPPIDINPKDSKCWVVNEKFSSTNNLQPDFGAVIDQQDSRHVNDSQIGNTGSPTHTCEDLTKDTMVVKRKFQGYCSLHKILLVGEGDFSFSESLAQSLVSATNMVATSLNSEEYLKSNYKDAMKNVSELKMKGCVVMHEVDATTIANRRSMKGVSFDRIIYNFPHCGDFSPKKSGVRKNQKLVRLFLENAIKLIKDDGEIHIRHKLTAAFSKWCVKGLASEVGLVLLDEVPFHFRVFKGYNPKYGYARGNFASDDNFNCHPSCTYKFALPGHPKNLGR